MSAIDAGIVSASIGAFVAAPYAAERTKLAVARMQARREIRRDVASVEQFESGRMELGRAIEGPRL